MGLALHTEGLLENIRKASISSHSGKYRRELTESIAKSSLELADLPVYQNVLLLQGPVGPFFSKLASFFRQRGTKTHKINFNPGDEWFYSPKEANTFLYNFTLDYWPEYLEQYLVRNQITAIFLFGDCRPIHQPAKQLCEKYGLDLWVFEEGYYRPHYFTMEYFGVNANSSFYKKSIASILELDSLTSKPQPDAKFNLIKKSHLYRSLFAVTYWMINILLPFKCANYDHHRQLNFFIAYKWLKNFFAYWVHALKDYGITKKLLQAAQDRKEKTYFLVPLQVHDDAQMVHHSDFESVEEVIGLVINSFYKHLSLEKNSAAKLIIKHHPMDRGHKNYAGFIKTLSRALGISNHVYYLHDLDLDLILPLCKGFITVNSTIGLKALDFGVPVKNLGRSFYDKSGITTQKSLQEFWGNPEPVSQQNVQKLRRSIIAKTQINGCFYSPKYQLK